MVDPQPTETKTPDPFDWLVNKDGTGRIFDEIREEWHRGYGYNIGLIGYSHGGGIIRNMSDRIWEDLNSVFVRSPKVQFAATIDAIDYGEMTGLAEWSSVTQSPAQRFGTTGVNYWESIGFLGSGYLPGWVPLWWVDVYGAPMTGATNHQFSDLNHSTITNDPWIISDIERSTDNVFGQLPN